MVLVRGGTDKILINAVFLTLLYWIMFEFAIIMLMSPCCLRIGVLKAHLTNLTKDFQEGNLLSVCLGLYVTLIDTEAAKAVWIALIIDKWTVHATTTISFSSMAPCKLLQHALRLKIRKSTAPL